ncbi:hypothetical protein [Microviridae sp.]|nr:hypothetical protein [Microviridae sp.]
MNTQQKITKIQRAQAVRRKRPTLNAKDPNPKVKGSLSVVSDEPHPELLASAQLPTLAEQIHNIERLGEIRQSRLQQLAEEDVDLLDLEDEFEGDGMTDAEAAALNEQILALHIKATQGVNGREEPSPDVDKKGTTDPIDDVLTPNKED